MWYLEYQYLQLSRFVYMRPLSKLKQFSFILIIRISLANIHYCRSRISISLRNDCRIINKQKALVEKSWLQLILFWIFKKNYSPTGIESEYRLSKARYSNHRATDKESIVPRLGQNFWSINLSTRSIYTYIRVAHGALH